MAYDYDVDILAMYWTGIEDGEEPYATFIAENPTLTDEVAENRILSTIELLRSHMELLQTRGEAKLLHESISKLFRHTAGGSNPWSDAASITDAIGNVPNPVFPPGANIIINIDGVDSEGTSASGGDCATVAAELNVTFDAPIAAVAEVFTAAAEGDSEGSLGSKYFTLNSANDAVAYYAWMSHGGRVETTTIAPIADVGGALGETQFDINGSGGEDYRVWFSHNGLAEVTEITVAADVNGSHAEEYFTIRSGSNAPFFVWYSHDGIAEVTEITLAADVNGSHEEEYFTLNSGSDASFYVWYSHGGIGETTSIAAVGDVNGNLGGTYFTINTAADAVSHYVYMTHDGIAESFGFDVTAADVNGSLGATYITLSSPTTLFYAWLSHGATAGFADAAVATAPAGTVVPGIAAATYDFDATINGGGNQPLSITTIGGEDYDGIATLMSAVPVAGGTVAFTGGAFRLTSSTTGAASAATLAVGTALSGGGDLFAAITAATSNAVTFPAATAGLAAAVDPTPGGTGIPVIYTVNDAAATIGDAFILDIDLNVNFSTSGEGAEVSVTNAAVGAATDATGGDTGYAISITQQGVDVNETDPAPGGTGVEIAYAINDTAGTLGGLINTALGTTVEGYSASGTDPVLVTTDGVGVTTDSAEGTSGFTVTTTQQGIDAAETDPSPGGTGLEVSYAINASADSLAEGTVAVIDGNGNFGADDLAPGVVTVTNAAIGDATDATGGTVGFGISVTQQGLDAAESAPATEGTGLEVMYSVNATADNIAEGTSAVVDGNGNFGATDVGGVVTVTNAAAGDATDASGGTVGFGILVTTQGIDAAESDPTAEGTPVEIPYTIGATADTLAGLITAALDPLEGLSAEGATSPSTVTTVTAATSDVPDATAGDTGFAVTVTIQGLDAAVDPLPGGLTGIPVVYTVGASSTAMGEGVASAIGALPAFGATDEAGLVTVTNAATGPTTDAADVDTGWAITTTIQGTDAVGDCCPITAFCEFPGPRLGFRTQEPFVNFIISNGGGGIIGPAGIIPGPRASKPKQVSQQGRDLSLGHMAGTRRDPNLTS